MTHALLQVFDGVEIPEALLAQEAQHHPAPSSAEARRAAGHALAARALLLQRARALGLEAVPERDTQGREETEDEALIRMLLSKEVEAETASEDVCRAFYERHADDFRAPDLYAASHILCAPEGEGQEDLEAARMRGTALIKDLIAGTPFERLAKNHSDCSSGAAGGQLGQLQSGDLDPAVEDALMRLDPGAVSPEPVPSKFGWHILRLEALEKGRVLPFDYVLDDIRMYLDSRAWVLAASRYGRELAHTARQSGVVLSLSEEGEARAPTLSLGTFLKAGEHDWARLEHWLQDVDPDLASALDSTAMESGCSGAELVQTRVQAFLSAAGDEEWTSLISAAQRGDDPMLESVRFILRESLIPEQRRTTLIGGR